jgi:hypothetical protein
MAALLAALVMLTAAQSQQVGFGGFGTGPTSLVNSKTVLADIKATDEQAAKLREWAKEFPAKQFAAMKDIQGAPQKKAAAMTAEAWKGIGEVLKPDQVKRLKQIELQAAGVTAFSRPEVVEALKFTDDQKAKIREAGGTVFRTMVALREEFGATGFAPLNLEPAKKLEHDKKLAAINKEMRDAVETALTDEQKKKWKEMTGDPIDVTKVQSETRPQFDKKKD